MIKESIGDKTQNDLRINSNDPIEMNNFAQDAKIIEKHLQELKVSQETVKQLESECYNYKLMNNELKCKIENINTLLSISNNKIEALESKNKFLANIRLYIKFFLIKIEIPILYILQIKRASKKDIQIYQHLNVKTSMKVCMKYTSKH